MLVFFSALSPRSEEIPVNAQEVSRAVSICKNGYDKGVFLQYIITDNDNIARRSVCDNMNMEFAANTASAAENASHFIHIHHRTK